MLEYIKANHLRLRVYAIADPLYHCATELAGILASSREAYLTRLKDYQTSRRPSVLYVLLRVAETGLYLEREAFD